MMRVLGWLVTLTGVAFSTGCYPLRHGITYYPPGAINLPAGSSARQWQVAQSDKVHSDGLVLYEAAWIDRSAELGPAAIARIANACHSESEPLCTVTLEAAPDDSLNNKRVQAVIDLANKYGVSLPPESIVVGHPDGNVIYGAESAQIAREMMRGNRRPRGSLFGNGSGGIFGIPYADGFTGSFLGDR